MLSTPPTLPQQVIARVCAGVAFLGLDITPALTRVGIEPAKLDDLPARVPLKLLYDLWEAVVEETGESGIGLRLSQQIRPEMYEVFGFVLRSSATLGDALLRATRFMRLVTDMIELSFQLEGERAVLTHRPLYPELLHRESSEFILGAIGAIARQITQQHLVPMEVRFTHDAPPDLTHHERIFEAPVAFRQPHNGYVFSSALLHLPIVGSDSKLCDELVQQAEQMLQRLPKAGDLSRRVQELISAELRGGNPSAESIADHLGMHPKTLSRRLKAEGTSHQQLLDQLRYELAERYLRQPALSIGEVAFLLGYSDTSSFNKAFKRWTAMAPQAYRQRTLSAATAKEDVSA